MMLVSDSYKFALFHFPKTGGSSMTYALQPVLRLPEGFWEGKIEGDSWQGKHHIDFIQHRPVRECKIPVGYFKAAFVRNPFEVVFSAWDRKQSFHEFVVEDVMTGKNIATRWTAHDYLTDSNGTLAVDFVGKYETLDTDWKKFCWIIGLENLDLLKLNVSEERDNYRDHYNEQIIMLVSKKFKADLNFFGYTYDA